MAEVDKAVQALQDIWYMGAVNGLGLDKTSFMLIQPGASIPYTTSDLWQVIDAIPPKALTTVMSMGSLNSFYQNYGSLFSAVIAPISDDFKRVMGDYLSEWMDYKKTVNSEELKSANGWPGLFEYWAGQNMPDNLATTAISVFNKDTHNIVNLSSKKYFSSNTDHPFDHRKNTLYNIKIDDIVGGAIAHGPKKEIHVNSKTSTADVSTTWAKGGVSGFLSIFSMRGVGSSSKTTTKFANSEITIDATFQHVITVQTFKPGDWFNSGFLNYAYKDANTWSSGNPKAWANTFGPDGNLQRIIEGLIVVDGIDIKMTSKASYSTDEQIEITAQTSGGIWPFFSVNASGGYNSKVSFNDQGQMEVKTSCPLGNPAIFGANIRSISSYFSNMAKQTSATTEVEVNTSIN